MEKVLVIGSNSFSGSDFIDLLLQEQTYQIIGVSRSEEKSSLFLPYKNKNSPLFQFFQIDLNKDLEKLKVLCDVFKPDFIVNFAAQSEVAPSWQFPHHWYETNVVSLTKLIDFLKDKDYLKKYVHISSPEVYGTCEGVITEESPLNPSTPYAASKAAADLSLFTYFKNFSFPLVIIRATNVYGAHQQLFKIIPRSFIYVKKDKKIELHGGGNAIKSYIHVRDVSNGELKAMKNGKIGNIYHLSPNQGIAIKTVVQTICDLMNIPFEKAVLTAPERLGQDKAYIIDSTKAKKELGWRPVISLQEGLSQTRDWVLNQFSTIEKEPLEYIHKA